MELNLSINNNIINKDSPAASGWHNVIFSPDELKAHIESGFAFSTGILKSSKTSKKPTSSDIASAEMVAIDVDNDIKDYDKKQKIYVSRTKTVDEGYISYNDMLNDAWIQKYALLSYPSFSSSDECNKFRVVFKLERHIYDPIEFSKIAETLIKKFGGDVSCKNIDRIFFGNSNAEAQLHNNFLPNDELDRLMSLDDDITRISTEYKAKKDYGDVTKDMAEAMLSHIPKRMSYDEWGKIVSGIANHFDFDTAVELIENWSPDERQGTAYKVRHASKNVSIGSVIFYAHANGFDKKKWDRANKLSNVSVATNGSIVKAQDYFNLTELGNAERFLKMYKNLVRFNNTSGRWHVWNGSVWTEDETNIVFRYAMETVRNIKNEAENYDYIEKNKIIKHAEKSESRPQLTNLLFLAATGDEVSVTHNEFDRNLYYINLKNGIYDLRANQFIEHKPEYMLSKQMNCEYNEQAQCYAFESAMDLWMDNDQELVRFVQRALGLTLCGGHLEEVFFFCYGAGKNGKSIFFQVLKMLLGDYHQKAPTDMLEIRRAEGVPNDIARLPGARMVVIGEWGEDRRLNENKIKDLTGGDLVSARFLHKEFFDFKPTHSFWLYGNHKPTIKGADDGIWRRVMPIPFNVTIPKEEQRPSEELMLDFEIERDGIFNWIIQGWKDYQINGLNPPDIVTGFKNEYRQEQDLVLEFIVECCQKGPELKVAASKLMEKYLEWCKKNNLVPYTNQKFYKRISEEPNVRKEKVRNYNTFFGIDLNYN